MRSMPRRSSKHSKKKRNQFLIITLLAILIVGSIGLSFYIKGSSDGDGNIADHVNENNEPDSEDQGENNAENEVDSDPDPEPEPEPDPEPEETFTDIRIAVAGDIMAHSSQIKTAWEDGGDYYDFKPMFEDVRPILREADMTIANFETTTAGPELEYTGYPMFNSPDSLIDALVYTGVDVLTTANNHSLDTRDSGLIRTVQQIRE